MNDPVSGIALGIVIAGLALSTFVTRTSFLLAGSRVKLGHKVEVALRYAPVCTLAAIIVPDVLMHGPAGLDLAPLNPRLLGVIAAGISLCFSRNVVVCLVAGLAAFSLARLYL